MNDFFRSTALFFLVTISFSQCATICGGSHYNANILVNGRPSAEIVYQGLILGNGSASMRVKRNHADKFSLTVKEKGCEDQTFNYRSRTFRGWSLVGTLLVWTTSTFIPYGAAIDLATGAFWKPDIFERGVTKHNYKNFQYTLNYTGCETKKEEVVDDSDKLVDVVYLKNGSMIRGTLLENEPSSHIKIQTRDGSIFVYRSEEVFKITRE